MDKKALFVFGYSIILLGLFGLFCFLMTTVDPGAPPPKTKLVENLRRQGQPKTICAAETRRVEEAGKLKETKIGMGTKKLTEAEKVENTTNVGKLEIVAKEEAEPGLGGEEQPAEEEDFLVEEDTEEDAKRQPMKLNTGNQRENALKLLQTPVKNSRRNNVIVRFIDKNRNVVKVTQKAYDARTTQKPRDPNITTTVTTTTTPAVKGVRRSAADGSNEESNVILLKLLPNNTYIFV